MKLLKLIAAIAVALVCMLITLFSWEMFRDCGVEPEVKK